MSNPTWTAKEVADALAASIKPDTKTTDVMIGAAAFVSAMIWKHYPAPTRKQQVINFANAVLDMLIAVDLEEARKRAGLEPLDPEDRQEAWMKWSQ